MKPEERDLLHLEHVAAYARDTLDFTKGGREAFFADKKTQAAGMRDVLIHQYDFLDLQEIWDVVEMELPRVLAEVTAILRKKGT